MRNNHDKEGALRLKMIIQEYWAERGYDVSLKIVNGEFSEKMRSCRFDVRSDMVNGMPQRVL